MSLFSKPKAVLWPKSLSVNLYLDKPENNIFSVDVNLWHACTPAELQSLNTLFVEQGITSCTILIPDDVVFTKSFIYDSEITTIDKNEVIGLAESFINFKIDPNYIDYKLIPSNGKTIIQAHIFDLSKINILETNLKSLNLKSFSFESVSSSIAKIISQKFDGEYFLIYPLGGAEYTLLLAKGDSVYLSSSLKGKELEIQKTVNYSKLYFPALTSKFYIPSDFDAEIIATSALDKTSYNQTSLATESKKAANLPLPVLGILVSKEIPPAIINQVDTSSLPPKPMENKKNILPFIAVFIVTAAVASIIIWFVLNKNNTPPTETPIGDNATPTEATAAPTAIPTVMAETINKKLKLQVLNATEINGQAAVLKEKLTGLGFTSIAVGNSKDKLTENQIKIKASESSAAAYFVQQLAGFFDATPTTDLPASSTYDVVFYIGTKLDAAATTTAPKSTVTPTATKSATTVTPTAKVTVKPTVTPVE
jgi:hypothetical protein